MHLNVKSVQGHSAMSSRDRSEPSEFHPKAHTLSHFLEALGFHIRTMCNLESVTISPLLYTLFPPCLFSHFPSCSLLGCQTDTFGFLQFSFSATARNLTHPSPQLATVKCRWKAEPEGSPTQMAAARRQQ